MSFYRTFYENGNKTEICDILAFQELLGWLQVK